MRMTKVEVKIYNQQFDAEMAEMSISECRKWNPNLSEQDAEHMITKAQTACSKRTAICAQQSALF